MKKILTVLFCLLTFAAVYANGNKKEAKSKDDVNVKIDIRSDGKNEIRINGKAINDKEIEDLVNKYLKNVSIEVNDDSGKKSKKVELSLSIKEK